MRIKVYLPILVSLILAVFVNSLGATLGSAITKHSNREAAELALNGRSIDDVSQEEVNELMRSPEFLARLIGAEQEVADKYWWYVVANISFHILLILIICLACGKFIIHSVVRHENS